MELGLYTFAGVSPDPSSGAAITPHERIKNLIGVTATINVEPNNSIERTLVGKARRVVDQRKK